ncbi:hypothetical protein GCM10025868_06770 [Angustibacter aerolatus]|uniref:Penicillin-binding protein transpeptidase domain-containing protein n=1 Tax=Angustibacter aerolatus TaxID=1162965 RepID=A0ABQ6JEU5_9ACTN|nr:hypothetical protein GCM10025868_06770 [Angustibacter aerolatus]
MKESKAKSGVVVVMTRTGQILALANAPGFNPNDTRGAKAENMYNRALSEVYEPGSTSKIMTAAAALEEGVVTPTTPFSVDSTVRRAGRTFHDSHAHPTEHLTFAGVLAKSSNVGTILAGEKAPATTMHDYLVKFGVGQPSGLRFPGESRGILAPVADWSGTQRYTVLFGQGLSVNAVQAAGVYQTIANDGVRVAPQAIASTTDATGRVVPAATPKQTRVVSKQTASTLRDMLEGVVSKDGTAPEARIAGYRVAGKTGTAQYSDPTCGCYRGFTGSFIGMAPADDPQPGRGGHPAAPHERLLRRHRGGPGLPRRHDVRPAEACRSRRPARSRPGSRSPPTSGSLAVVPGPAARLTGRPASAGRRGRLPGRAGGRRGHLDAARRGCGDRHRRHPRLARRPPRRPVRRAARGAGARCRVRRPRRRRRRPRGADRRRRRRPPAGRRRGPARPRGAGAAGRARRRQRRGLRPPGRAPAACSGSPGRTARRPRRTCSTRCCGTPGAPPG